MGKLAFVPITSSWGSTPMLYMQHSLHCVWYKNQRALFGGNPDIHTLLNTTGIPHSNLSLIPLEFVILFV